MTETRPHLVPGPDHPITIAPSDRRVVARVGSEVVADTIRAVELKEADYPPVMYVPLDAIDRSRLRDSDRHTYCPYKGEASYYDILGQEGPDLEAAAWYYPDPYPEVDAIRGLVAFYADRVSITVDRA